MGTHISKVKSVDLDVWTPEQMQVSDFNRCLDSMKLVKLIYYILKSILKWGNRRANLYWEAHLKAGHVPPDHKIESFIRSKYELRKWAMDGPVPDDPSVLESSPSSGVEETARQRCRCHLFQKTLRRERQHQHKSDKR